jgi:hypothetical protein
MQRACSKEGPAYLRLASEFPNGSSAADTTCLQVLEGATADVSLTITSFY